MYERFEKYRESLYVLIQAEDKDLVNHRDQARLHRPASSGSKEERKTLF